MTAQVSYWILPVEDIDRAMAFFGRLLGWTFSEPGSAGGRHVLGSEPWGGLAPAGGAPQDRVLLAFAPDDLDAAIETVRGLGGTAEESGDSSHGRWVECTDDQGTRFALFERPDE